jgi:hypothetical protein
MRHWFVVVIYVLIVVVVIVVACDGCVACFVSTLKIQCTLPPGQSTLNHHNPCLDVMMGGVRFQTRFRWASMHAQKLMEKHK